MKWEILVLMAGSLLLWTAEMTHAQTPLEQALLTAVRQAQFHEVIDFGAGMEDRDIPAGTAKSIPHTPHVDIAIIQLDPRGRAVSSANVLLSRDHPNGIVVPCDPERGSWRVQFLPWNIDQWNGGRFRPGESTPAEAIPWNPNTAPSLHPTIDDRNIPFMSPYPASLFKLLIAFHIFQMVDRHEAHPDTPLTWTNPGAPQETHSLMSWIETMLTVSDNRSTQMLLQWLHQKNQMQRLNQGFRDLGLSTLQIHGTRATDGGGWQPGQIHMTAYDTARLLWLIDGGTSVFWKAPSGKSIRRNILSEASRARLKQMLLDQAFHEILSTSVLTGHPHVQPGIPARISQRWIDPTQGTVSVEGVQFGRDIRDSNRDASVTFAHKTGLTYNYASDAGIVESLPGHPRRRYIIAFFSNLGYRYADPVHAQRSRGPYSDPVSPIVCTQKIPALGKAVDDFMVNGSGKKATRPGRPARSSRP